MIFLFIIPFGVGGLGNYLVPLMIGARDMAFPKINALSFWMIPPAGLLILSGFFVPTPAGCTQRAPPMLAGRRIRHSACAGPYGQSLWLVGVFILGMSSILGSINFLVTILNMRAPGMTMHRMPLFVWAILTTSFIQLMATPALAGVLLMLLADRHFGTNFFDPAGGGDVLGYQHGFWFYSHPAVYIMILPYFGVISEVVQVFSREADLRLQGGRVLDRRHRHPGLSGVGAPYVHRRSAGHQSELLHADDDADRHPNRHQDLQLGGDPVGRPPAVQDAAAVRASAS